MSFERVLRWALVSIAIVGLAAGILAYVAGRPGLDDLCWTLATAPVVAGLAVSIVRDFLAGRFGVDAVALVSMSAALAPGQPLAGAVVALMYSGGNVLEEIAVARAEHDLRSLVDRAPRVAHRRVNDGIEDVPIGAVAIDDRLLVRAGEVVPVDGVVTSDSVTIDESALTGEPIPVVKSRGAAIFSGSLNTGDVLANAVVQAAAERGLALKVPEQVRESMGAGLQGVVDGRRVSAGSRDMILSRQNAPEWALRAVRRASWRSALIVFVAVEGKPIGALLLADELRSDTPRAIRMLREAGVARIVMVTGDRAAAAQAIGAALDLDAVLADRVPSDKVDAVRSEQRIHPTILVGDGINDAPALASADVGIALGARAAPAPRPRRRMW